MIEINKMNDDIENSNEENSIIYWNWSKIIIEYHFWNRKEKIENYEKIWNQIQRIE